MICIAPQLHCMYCLNYRHTVTRQQRWNTCATVNHYFKMWLSGAELEDEYILWKGLVYKMWFVTSNLF